MDKHEVILLVEDDPNDTFFIQSAYAKAGIRQRLEVVTNGLEAIHYLSGQGNYSDRVAHPLPALILLDIGLPVKNGFEVLEWIQRHEKATNHIVVIVLTGVENKAMEDKACRLGSRGFLKKPISLNELDAMILRLKQEWID